MVGTLYVVSTPIGNAEDMSARGQRILAEVAVVAAEDTRRSGALLETLGVNASFVSYHDHNEQERTPQLIERLQAGESVALVSDAGTPLVSDPGYRLVRACQDAGVPVVPVPGASAVLAALAVAGLPTDTFSFVGFLPSKGRQREQAVRACLQQSATTVLFEAPHRVLSLLEVFVEQGAGEREMTLCRELTKHFETVRRATIADLAAWVKTDRDQQKGEIVLVLAGAPKVQFEQAAWQPLARRLLQELPAARVAKVLADFTGENRQALYQWLTEQEA